jgi:hypothetical protein
MVPDYQEAWPDMEVEYLVISTKDYIVCLDKCLDVDWKTSDDYDKKGHNDEEKFNKVLNSVALLESKPQHHLDINLKKNFRRMLGEAIARALSFDYKSAHSIVDQAQAFLVDRSREKSRQWYLVSGAVAAAILCCFGVLLITFRTEVVEAFGGTLLLLLFSSVSGGVGAFVSITLRLGKSTVEAVSGKFLHAIEALARIFTGIFSGFIAGIMVKLGVLLPAFSTPDVLPLAIVAVGFVAGSSERFIPTLISTMEENKGNFNE